jgi:hypothetical protein
VSLGGCASAGSAALVESEPCVAAVDEVSGALLDWRSSVAAEAASYVEVAATDSATDAGATVAAVTEADAPPPGASHVQGCQLPSAHACAPTQAFSPVHARVAPPEQTSGAQELSKAKTGPNPVANQVTIVATPSEFALRRLDLARIMVGTSSDV